MVGVFGLLTARRIFLGFVVLVIAVGVAGRLAAAAVSEGPSASFTVDPGSPLSGDTVSFTSTATDDGTIVTQDWDFGDGATGSDSVVGHAYPVPGIYSVRLTVTDDESLTATHTENVTVGNRNPTADFHHSPADPLVGDTVAFTSDSTDPEDRIDIQRWDLDDDGTYEDTGATSSTVFTSGGPHTVTLLVEDQDGGTDTITKTIDVIDPPNQAPNPAFDFSPTDPMVLDTVTFTSKSKDDDGSIVSTLWDFQDDGVFDASGTQVTHSYLFGGDYTVRVLVTDNEGTTADLTKVVTVGVPPNDPPSANFNVSPGSPKTLETVTFDSTSVDPDGTIATYAWELDGDGDFNDHSGSTATLVFPQSGTYTISLKVIDNDGDSSVKSKDVVVANRPPVSDFEFSPAAPQKNQTVDFTSLAVDPENRIQSLEWDLDNDNAFDDAFGATAQTSFGSPGSKTVRLKVTDRDGATHTATKTLSVENLAPTASFVVSPELPLSLTRVTFTSTSTDPDGTIADVRWDTDNDGAFDDGSDIEASRVFTSAGTKTVRLRVTDDDGKVVTTSLTVPVTNRPPTAVITAPTTAPKNTPVTFKSTSTDVDGSIAKTEWDTDGDGYDDGTGSQVVKSFSASGPKTIHLRVTDDLGEVDEDVHVVDIGGNNASPVPAFSFTPSSPLTGAPGVQFTSTSTDSDGTIVKLEWDFDNDGTFDISGTSKTVTRQFPLPGPQLVTLRVTDEDGASQALTKTVTVLSRAPSVQIGQGTASPVTLEPVVFTATGTDPDGSITSYLWDFDNDGGFDDQSGDSVPWTFTKKGSYTIKVKVTDDFGVSATATRVVNVANTLPRATFAHDPPSPNPRDVVTMTSTSLDPDGSVTKVEWDTDNDGAFDDGVGQKVTKTFLTSGNQTVRLRVTDDDGGQSIGSQTIVVGNRPPTASFDFRPAAPVAGQLVTMFSTSDDPDKNIESTDWDLDGDGSFEASGSSVGKAFPAGSFNVSMRVTDTEGSFAIVTQTIAVAAPAPAPRGETNRLRALTPFPIVRMAGRIGSRGTRLRVLTVDAPTGSTVTVRCKGRGCPFTKSTRASRAGERLAHAARKVRIRKLEGRMLRAGVVVRIFVTKAGTIGKFTSIKIRGGKPPKRVDRCLMPGSMKPVQCQS